MSEWEMVIGLEVHCELATTTKLFCACRNAFGDEPNVNPEIDCDVTEDGLLAFKPDRAEHVLFHDCPDPREAARHLRPMAPPFTQQSPNAVAWKAIPSTYVVCTQDRATAVGVQRTLSTRAAHARELPSSHSAFLSHPARLAEIINNAR